MEENTTNQEITQEDLQELLQTDFYFPVDLECLGNIKMNKKEFQKGVDSVSELCGQISALKSVGIDNQGVVDLVATIINKDNLESQNQASITIAEKNAVQIDKNQI